MEFSTARYVPRRLEKELSRAARAFPALILTGPRRAGKTTLLRKLLPRAEYHSLEDPDLVARVRADPRAFLDGVRTPVILDELQNLAELLNYVRTRIDASPRRCGAWYLTGSQEAGLMRGVTEALQRAITRHRVRAFVAYRRSQSAPATDVLAPGVQALDCRELVERVAARA